VTVVLRSIPKEAFADSFQKLYERCQQYVVTVGDYFKVNKDNLFVSSVSFVFWYHSPNFLDTSRIFYYEEISRISRTEATAKYKTPNKRV
jgi:hypothetical protein